MYNSIFGNFDESVQLGGQIHWILEQEMRPNILSMPSKLVPPLSPFLCGGFRLYFHK